MSVPLVANTTLPAQVVLKPSKNTKLAVVDEDEKEEVPPPIMSELPTVEFNVPPLENVPVPRRASVALGEESDTEPPACTVKSRKNCSVPLTT